MEMSDLRQDAVDVFLYGFLNDDRSHTLGSR